MKTSKLNGDIQVVTSTTTFNPTIHCLRADVVRDLRKQAQMSESSASLHRSIGQGLAAAEATTHAAFMSEAADAYEAGRENAEVSK